ncbi:MAG: hypothetical protein AB1806_14305 [Acidobacteriota bacterium]
MDRIKRWPLPAGIAAVLIGLWAGPAEAQGLMGLSLSASSVTFPAADPDTTPVIAAPPLTITFYSLRRNWQITVIASGDLTSGSSSIPISNVSWTATPAPPFQDGVMSSTVAQLVASGNAWVYMTGTIFYSLVNSWTYNVGTYSVTITYTLSAV